MSVENLVNAANQEMQELDNASGTAARQAAEARFVQQIITEGYGGHTGAEQTLDAKHMYEPFIQEIREAAKSLPAGHELPNLNNVVGLASNGGKYTTGVVVAVEGAKLQKNGHYADWDLRVVGLNGMTYEAKTRTNIETAADGTKHKVTFTNISDE